MDGHPRTILLWSALLAAILVVVTACSHESFVDKVTVTAGTKTVTLPVALSCTGPTGATKLTCSGGENDANAPHIKLAPGQPVTVSVPKAVGDTPWVVVFRYTDSKGKTHGDRSSVFGAKKRYSFDLHPPKGAQLDRLEVQSLIAAPAPNGGVEFPAVRTWVLLVDAPAGSG